MSLRRIGALLALAVSLFGLTAGAQSINLPPVMRQTWPNGIRVLLMEYRRAPTLTVRAVFPGGSSQDPVGKTGTAQLTADLLTKGTTKRTATQIAEEIDFLGGSLTEGAGDDRLSVGLSVLAKDADAGLELMADVLRNPTFPAEELERQRDLFLNALRALPEDPAAVASRVASQAVFGTHPYGREATLSSVESITREDVREYGRRFIAPDRMILVAVGDFQAPAMLNKLKARFGDWAKTDSAPSAVPPVTAGPRQLVLVDKPDAVQTQLRLARVGKARKSADFFAGELADAILGGGFTSRLTEEIRVNRGLTYGIGSGFSDQLHGGLFSVSSFTRVETTRALIDAVRQVLRNAAEKGLTEAELTKAKGFLTGLFAIRVQTPEALAGELADIAFYGLPQDYLKTYLSRLKAVTLADANRIARTYFHPDRMSLILVGPAAKVRNQLSGLGAIQTRAIAEVVR